MSEEMTEGQIQLKSKHGTPREFASAVWRAMPEFLSWKEAQDAVAKYQEEWDSA